MPVSALPADALYHACAPDRFTFTTSEELLPLRGLFGQERALEAIRFGTRMEHAGYNLFVLGEHNAGHGEAVAGLLREIARNEPVPADWVYLTNFEAGNRPLAISLAPGGGRRLRRGVAAAVVNLRNALPAIFQNDQYLARRKAIDEAFEQRYDEALQRLQASAAEEGIALISSPRGLTALPLNAQGEPMSPQEIEALTSQQRAHYENLIETLGEAIEDITRTEIPGWEAERIGALHTLNTEFAQSIVRNIVGEVKKAFPGEQPVAVWLDAFGKDIVENIALFAPQADEHAGQEVQQLPGMKLAPEDSFRRYEVNLLVDNAETQGAPVVVLDHFTLGHVVGRIDISRNGFGVPSDAGHIRAGALHRANGGYLVINAGTVLSDPVAFEALRLALMHLKVTIESPANYDSYYRPAEGDMLEPQPVPLDLKVVLYGPPGLYYGLCRHEPDFMKLFKVQVEFSDDIERSPDSELLLARLIATMAREDGLKSIDRTGMARMIEFASREADDGGRLTLLNEPLRDLVREADFQAGEAGARAIARDHVEKALGAKTRRANYTYELVLEPVREERRIVETAGVKVGQINSLAVYVFPNIKFGTATRVSVRVRRGGGSVINIERKVGYAGKQYSKGVEILTSWVMAKFGETGPIPIEATIAKEQSVNRVDGASASSTELYALLSAMADVPIRQNLAATGAVSQFGEVQVIGGVNEKIEAFFDICASRGLTGDQGVVIPAANVPHLMLRADIVEAASAGRFHIYPVKTIEEGIELFAGMPAGEKQKDGSYPENSVYGRIVRRLEEFKAANGNGKTTPPKRRGWF